MFCRPFSRRARRVLFQPWLVAALGLHLLPSTATGRQTPPAPTPTSPRPSGNATVQTPAGAGAVTGIDQRYAAAFDSAERQMTAERLGDDERVVLDGILDEPAWKRAVPAADFVQQDPTLGGTPTEATEVRIAFNRRALYMGASPASTPSPTNCSATR